MTKKTWLGGLVLALLVSACARAPAKQPVSGNFAPLAPADLLPSDLDFVVRIDSGRVRSSPVFAGAFRSLAQGNASRMLRSVLPALEQSRSILFGGRLMSDGFRGDGVVAIELDSASDRPRDGGLADPSFHAVPGSPPGALLLERSAEQREDAVLEVVLEGGLVLATAAEADAVLRVVQSSPDLDRLDPPARGLASFAGRLRGSGPVDGDMGLLAQVREGLRRFSGTVEASEGFQVDADFVYDSVESAEKAAASARSLLDRLKSLGPASKALADSAKLAASAEALRVRATVPFALVASVH